VQDILDRLQPLFRDVLDDPKLVISRDSNGNTVAGWDSLAHITIVAETEREFGVRFALGELESLKNVGDMVDLIAAKLKAA
jgi:acyl carrier protein